MSQLIPRPNPKTPNLGTTFSPGLSLSLRINIANQLRASSTVSGLNELIRNSLRAIPDSELTYMPRLLMNLYTIQGMLLSQSVMRDTAAIRSLYKPAGALEKLSETLKLLGDIFSSRLELASYLMDDNQSLFVAADVARVTRNLEEIKMLLFLALRNKKMPISKIIDTTGSTIGGNSADDPQEKAQKWLSKSTKSEFLHAEATRIATPGTGAWFIQSDYFSKWIIEHSILWLFGPAGSGKTTLCAITIEHLKSQLDREDALAYFYFDSRTEGQMEACLRSLIAQLCGQMGLVPMSVLTLFQGNRPDQTRFDTVDLVDILLSIFTRRRRTFLVIDAMDQATELESLLGFVSVVSSAKGISGVSFLVSSRRLQEFQRAFPHSGVVDIVEVDVRTTLNTDIRYHIRESIEANAFSRNWGDDMKEHVEAALLWNGGPSFAWVSQSLNRLQRCITLHNVTETLSNLSQSPFKPFTHSLQNIHEDHIFEVRSAFQWLAFSERPLHLDELCEAAILDPQYTSYTDLVGRRFSDSYDLIELCSDLVILQPAEINQDLGPRVTFVHLTVKELLLKSVDTLDDLIGFSETDAQQTICQMSLRYLLTSTQLGSGSDVPRQFELPLLGYVTEYWYSHVQAVIKSGKVSNMIVALLINLFDTKFNQSLPSGPYISNSDEPEGPKTIQTVFGFPAPLYYSSLLGITQVADKILERGDSTKEWSGFCGTPLHAAAYGGNAVLCKSLLDYGSDVNKVLGPYGSPLQAAMQAGHVEVAKILLEAGCNVNHNHESYGNALHSAAIGGYVDMADLFIDWGADIDMVCELWGSPLQAAALHDSAEVAQLLMEIGADINRQGGPCGNALIAAAKHGFISIATMLVENGARVNMRDTKDGTTALHVAADGGHKDIVAMPLKYAADPNLKAGDRGTPLQAAARGRHLDVIELLIKRGARYAEATTLFIAVEESLDSFVQYILNRSRVEVDSLNKEKRTALTVAADRGRYDVAKLLLDKGADVGYTDKDNVTAMMAAASNGHERLVRLLALHGADPYVKNNRGQTALDMATSNSHEPVASFLEHLMDMESTD